MEKNRLFTEIEAIIDDSLHEQREAAARLIQGLWFRFTPEELECMRLRIQDLLMALDLEVFECAGAYVDFHDDMHTIKITEGIDSFEVFQAQRVKVVTPGIRLRSSKSEVFVKAKVSV